MLTPQQIQILKKVQQMTNPALRDRWLKFFQLPMDLQEAIFSEKTNQRILDIAKQNNLMGFQASILFSIIGSFLSGEIPPNKLTSTIQEECLLEEIETKELVRQLTQEIFSPLKNSLQKIYEVTPTPTEERPMPLIREHFTPTQEAPVQSAPITPTPIRPISPIRPVNPIPQSVQNEPARSGFATGDAGGPRKIFVPKLDGNVINLRDLE